MIHHRLILEEQAADSRYPGWNSSARAMRRALVGKSRCDVPAREAAGGTIAPVNAARTAQRAVPTCSRLRPAGPRSAWLRRTVQVLRLHKLGNWWLRTCPMVKKLPGSGVVYRATRLESIPLAVEMFEKGNLYDAALLPKNFTTFADLGCNVGYFTCWLMPPAANCVA